MQVVNPVPRADQTAVQPREQLGGRVGVVGEGVKGADEHGDSHCGGKAFGADITENDECFAEVAFGRKRDDLKEVAAYLLLGAVDAGDLVCLMTGDSSGISTCWTPDVCEATKPPIADVLEL
jgi:hypothetical protein